MLTKLLTFVTSTFLTFAPTTKLTEGVVGQPTSFYPHETVTQNDKTISNLIYRGLFKYDIYGALEPDLADTWEVSEDGLVYTITLKENQYWSDGSKITSDDIIYTAFKSSVLKDVATDRVDDRTVRFTLPNKFSPFRSLLTTGIIKRGSQEEQSGLKPISSDQFKVISVKKSGPLIKEVVLYNREPHANIKKLAFRYYANEEELLVGAELGEVDSFLSSDEHDLPNFSNYKFPIQNVYYSLIFNLRSEKFSDVEFRQKLRNSLPIEELIMKQGIPVEGAISKSDYTKKDIKSSYYDEEMPEEILNESLVIKVPDIQRHKDLVKQIEHVWEDKFNLAIEVEAISPEKMLKDVIEPRDFEVLFYGQQVGMDPDRYVHWHSTQTEHPGLNISGFSQVRADRALEEGRNTTEKSERITHYNEFQEVIEEQVPAIFLLHPFKNYYVSDKVSGIGEKYTFNVGDRFLDFDNWKIPLSI